jgi:hypothetical protein
MLKKVRAPGVKPTRDGGEDKQARPLPGSRCKEGSGLKSAHRWSGLV